MKLGIVAGEASGDLLGAGLVKTLRESQPNLEVTGVAGPAMLAAGCETRYDMESLSVMGLIEPLRHLPKLLKMRSGLQRYFLENRPDVFIGIDSPDFNLGLEIQLRKANIPVVHYVSPSVWAWRQKRIFKIAKAVDLMLTLFPFEADFYQQHGVPVQFVGHPLADQIPLERDKLAARKRLNLDPDKIYIGLLPGSRANEIKYLAELFLKTAQFCWKKRPEIAFITSAVNPKRDAEFQKIFHDLKLDFSLQFFLGKSHDVMEASDVVLVTSGTATLETMLYKCPMVIAYRLNALTFQIAKRIVKIPHIGLPNLLANEKLVPEFIQDAATPENLSAALLDYINHPEKIATLQTQFHTIHQQLRRNANQQAAKAILDLVARTSRCRVGFGA